MSIPNHLVHTTSCAATKKIGRMGSRTGLHWAFGNHRTCDCGALDLLRRIHNAYSLAEISTFHNNDFEQAEQWEKRAFEVAEILGEKP